MTDELPDLDDFTVEIVCECRVCGDDVRCLATEMAAFPETVREDRETICPDCEDV